MFASETQSHEYVQHEKVFDHYTSLLNSANMKSTYLQTAEVAVELLKMLKGNTAITELILCNTGIKR